MNDDDLRTRFHQLRELDERAVPRFRVPRARASRPRFVVAAAMVVILSALALIAIRGRSVTFSESDRATAQSVAAWQPPTRFLLRTPADEMLTTTPVIPDIHDVLAKGATR
jgi:hypothetical protein